MPRHPRRRDDRIATNRRANSGTAPITGSDCSHGTCRRVRDKTTVSVLSLGRQAGLTSKECRRALRGLPGLLCQYSKVWPPPGTTPRELVVLQAAFAAATIELDVTGMLGQQMQWYPSVRAMLIQRMETPDTKT